jgi:8-oxo-dGTP diphosphatase
MASQRAFDMHANPDDSAPKTIGIAVVEHAGRYLVGLRPAGSPLAGYAEFPGGKCLPGESPAACACRECLEETGLEVVPVKLLHECRHVYPHGAVHLHFWLCVAAHAATIAVEHRGYRWVPAAELPTHRFPEANLPLIAQLSAASERNG